MADRRSTASTELRCCRCRDWKVTASVGNARDQIGGVGVGNDGDDFNDCDDRNDDDDDDCNDCNDDDDDDDE
jgi:hypothetical protein